MFPCVGTPLLYPGRRRKRKWILVAGCEGVMAFGDIECVRDNGGGDEDDSGGGHGDEQEGHQPTVGGESSASEPATAQEPQQQHRLVASSSSDVHSASMPFFQSSTIIGREQIIFASAAMRVSEKNTERKVAAARLRRRTSSVPNRNSNKSDLNLNLVPWLASVVDVESASALKCLLDRCGKWHFDAFVLSRLSGGHPVISLGCKIFELYQFADVFRLDWTTLCHCLSLIESGYYSNPYHNAIHAADVAQALHCFLQEPPVAVALSPLEKMSCILAAMGHDLFHPGVNQKFLENSNHHLCRLYKISVLENFHWRCLVNILVESNAFATLTVEEWQMMLATLEVLILATDMQRQQEYLDEFKAFLCNHSCSDPLDSHQNLTLMQHYLECDETHLSDPYTKTFVMQILIKCADIANPCRPWTLSRDWSLRASQEFFEQGDLERRLHMPVTGFCDRYATTVPKIQSGFMEYVAQPLFADWHQFMASPLSREMLSNLHANTMHWLKMQEEDTKRKSESRAAAFAVGSLEDEDEMSKSGSSGVAPKVTIRFERSSRSSVEDVAEMETQSPDILLKRRASSSAALLFARARRTSLYDEHRRRVSLPSGCQTSTLWTAASTTNRRLYQALSVGQLNYPPTVSLHLSETEPVLYEVSPEEYSSPPTSSRLQRRSVDRAALSAEASACSEDKPEEGRKECKDGHGCGTDDEDDDVECRKLDPEGETYSLYSLSDEMRLRSFLHSASGHRRNSEPAAVCPDAFSAKLSSPPPPSLLMTRCCTRRGSLPMTQKELEVFRMVGSAHDARPASSGSQLCQPIGVS